MIKKEVTYNPDTVMEVFGTSYLSYKEFADQLHFALNFMIYCLDEKQDPESDIFFTHSTTERLIMNFRQKLPPFLNCQKVTLWIKDPQ